MYICIYSIKYINNLILYQVSGQLSVSAFQFHVKNNFVLVKYKIKSSKPHSLLHLSLSQNQKFKSLMHFFFFLVYICSTFSLLSIYHGFFFFFGCMIILKKKKKTYHHIVMVINSKLVIDHDILKNTSSQNWPYHALYTAHVTIKLRCGAVMAWPSHTTKCCD